MAQGQNTADSITALKQIQTNWHRAYVVSDSTTLQSLLSPQVTITRSSGLVLKKSQALHYYRTRDTVGLLIATNDQVVRVNGGLAVITSRVNEIDKGIPYAYYVTDVLERKGSIWQILHSQWTVLPGQWEKIRVDSALLNKYHGTYESASGRKFVVEAQTDQLTLLNAQGRRSVFLPRSHTQFFIPGEPDQLVFINAASEQALSFVLVSGPNTTVFYRKN
jgi:hypothetical protein